MSHLKVARGEVVDIPFTLRSTDNGNLVDDDDWVDGSTVAEWPIVTIYDSAGVDVTATWNRDLTGDTLPTGALKHADPTTGIWRKDIGTYRFRTDQATSTLPLGDYTIVTEYDVNGARYQEPPHTLKLVESGDVDYGLTGFDSITVSEVKAGITTSLTDTQIVDIITEGNRRVKGWLLEAGVDPVDLPDLPHSVFAAVMDVSRAIILQRDLQAGYSLSEIKEDDKRARYAAKSPMEGAKALYDQAYEDIQRWARRYSRQRRPRARVNERKHWDQAVKDGRR